MNSLAHKVIAITGGSRGIGQALLQLSLTLNAKTAYCARKPLSEEQNNENCLFVITDVSDPKQIKNFIGTTIKHYGKIDVLIHNAAITKDHLLVTLPPDIWNEVIQTNLTSAFTISKSVIEVLLHQSDGGHLAFIGSLAASGAPSNACYATTKGGLLGLSSVIASQYSSEQITSNVFLLGLVDTGMTENYPKPARQLLVDSCSLKRSASPGEIAAQILYLITHCRHAINGQTIHLTGGLLDFPLGNKAALKNAT